jgi:hypothetical protein
MQPERDAVQATIESIGHTCIRAETLNSPGVSPEEACRSMAIDCDIYVGVYGGRYGYVPPHLGVSVTEYEYLQARDHNPSKVFIYVKDVDDVESEQDRFLTDVQDFAAGYFRHEKFASHEELAQQVRRDIIAWTTQHIQKTIRKDLELRALRDKISHMSRVMEMYGIPEDLR